MREERKSSNTKQPLCIYRLLVPLELSSMLWCTIWTFTHDLTHHSHNCYQYNHYISSIVTTLLTTSFWDSIILPQHSHYPYAICALPTVSVLLLDWLFLTILISICTLIYTPYLANPSHDNTNHTNASTNTSNSSRLFEIFTQYSESRQSALAYI
jgi:hypothetical protein